ncbi:MAG: TonB-dependent receptor plug domain-containing protein [Gelidibacter sp.]
MKAKFKLLFLFLFVVSISFAQEMTVTGTVTSSEDGMPLPGVNVIVQGTTTGTNSDFDGKYSLKVQKGAVLEFSSVGFKTQSVTVVSQTTIDIVMIIDVESLNEIVVVGYGTQKKEDLTGAISTVKSEDIQKVPTSNIAQSLQGKISGVQVISSGSPGDSPTVRLRGVGSFTGTNAPLYVVDGKFYDNIDFLNTNDIESMSVLKDASSAAIFG